MASVEANYSFRHFSWCEGLFWLYLVCWICFGFSLSGIEGDYFNLLLSSCDTCIVWVWPLMHIFCIFYKRKNSLRHLEKPTGLILEQQEMFPRCSKLRTLARDVLVGLCAQKYTMRKRNLEPAWRHSYTLVCNKWWTFHGMYDPPIWQKHERLSKWFTIQYTIAKIFCFFNEVKKNQ